MTRSPATRKKKILIVEDHPLFRAMLVQLIKQDLGMSVSGETNNLRDALTLIGQTKPDAAIVDLTLSGSSGLELLKEIKAQKIQLPVLVLSMHDEKLYAERALRAGAKGFISKEQSPAPSAPWWTAGSTPARKSPKRSSNARRMELHRPQSKESIPFPTVNSKFSDSSA